MIELHWLALLAIIALALLTGALIGFTCGVFVRLCEMRDEALGHEPH